MFNFKVILAFLSLFHVLCAHEMVNQRVTDVNEDILLFGHVVFRHGDRNPNHSYPTDKYKHWPGGFGQLTNIGIQQVYNLGRYLRDRYQTLLRNENNLNELVYAQSTDVDRTLMSAETVMAGMFPPNADRIWNDNLLWQPIPIHTTPNELDYIFSAAKPCPRLQRAEHAYQNSAEMIQFYAEYKPLFQYLEHNSGSPIKTISQVFELYDVLRIQQLKNKTLPEWTKSVFFKGSDFEYVALQDFKKKTNTTKLARLSIGFLIRDIFTRCIQKLENSLSPNRSLWIYSGHDTTIANILNAFGHFDLHLPTYAASVHFDLYKSLNGSYLQISYRNSSGEMILKFPKCGTKCSIDELQTIFEDIIPTDTFENECQLPWYIRVVEENQFCEPDYIIILKSIIVFVSIVFILSGLIFYRRRGCIKTDTKN